MNRNEALKVLHDELGEWPKPSTLKADVPDILGWDWEVRASKITLESHERSGFVEVITEADWATFERDLMPSMKEINDALETWPEDRIDRIAQSDGSGDHYAKRELNPPSSSLTHSEAREAAEITGLCADGYPCGEPDIDGDDLYCADCPNRPQSDEAPASNQPKDAINPSHYQAGKVECIDALAAATVNKTGIEAVCTANAIKYLWRYEQKNGIEDVRKARWYLERLIQELDQ